MPELTLEVRPMTEARMSALEERGLIQGFLPAKTGEPPLEGGVFVEEVYFSDPRFGGHRLIRVAFDRSAVQLAFHSDREDLILINDGRPQKPLILVIGMFPADEFKRRLAQGELSVEDIWALELKFNDPRLSFFTMNAFTPHCEWTPPGQGPANVFLVTEPRDLDMHPVDLGDYSLRIDHKNPGT